MNKIHSYFLIFVFYILSANSSAATIAGVTVDAIANQVTGSSGTFLNWNPAYDITGISTSQLSSDMTDTSAESYVFSYDANAYIDMAFTNTNVYNGEGADLAIFFVGADAHTGKLTLLDSNLGSISFSALTYTGYNVPELFNDINGNQIMSPIYVSYIDLAGLALGTNVLLNNFRLEIGNASAAPSLLAALNTMPTPVPLPPALLLFLAGIVSLAIKARK